MQIALGLYCEASGHSMETAAGPRCQLLLCLRNRSGHPQSNIMARGVAPLAGYALAVPFVFLTLHFLSLCLDTLLRCKVSLLIDTLLRVRVIVFVFV